LDLSSNDLYVLSIQQRTVVKNKKKIKSGFQLFNTLKVGYQFQFFIEPSVAFTYWPVNTSLPHSFQVEEDNQTTFYLN